MTKLSSWPITRATLVWLVLSGAAWCAEKPPVIEFVSPREGETVRGEISVVAKVNAPETVELVDIYIQEPGAKDRYSWKEYGPPPYVWGGKGYRLDTRLFADGQASTVLYCYTGGQKPATEKRVTFNIDNGKPVVKIVAPASGALLDGDAIVEVESRDPKGIRVAAGIVAVSLYLDGSLVRRLTAPPYLFALTGCLLAPGSHSIRAVAEDTEGLVSEDRLMVVRDKGGNPLKAAVR